MHLGEVLVLLVRIGAAVPSPPGSDDPRQPTAAGIHGGSRNSIFMAMTSADRAARPSHPGRPILLSDLSQLGARSTGR